jgi:hypothetical protein
MVARAMPTLWRSVKRMKTWPLIVNDAVRGELKEIYAPVDEAGLRSAPLLKGSVACSPDTKTRTAASNQLRLSVIVGIPTKNKRRTKIRQWLFGETARCANVTLYTFKLVSRLRRIGDSL